MSSFKKFDIPTILVKRLEKIGYIDPTPIQSKSIPYILNGNDLFGISQTGTGKTGAFIIPILSFILNNKNDSVLILTPTRELAMQILNFTNKIIFKSDNIYPTALIGGEPIFKQISKLKKSQNILIGTPGRTLDHISKNRIELNKIKYLILDEADRMLDMGFSDELNSIVQKIPTKRQTLMFTATEPKNILTLAKKYTKDPIRIATKNSQELQPKIKTETLFVAKNKKLDTLISELDKRKGSTIVFANTKTITEKITSKLFNDFKIKFLHGGLRQSKREKIIKSFRDRKFRILVTTDVLSRGIDIPHIKHVINYDIPYLEDYIHRIGRTGRAGSEGEAITFITPNEKSKWRDIEHFIETGNKQRKIKKTKVNTKKKFRKANLKKVNL